MNSPPLAVQRAPKCKRVLCDNPCQYYGAVGAYSVQCEMHNIDGARKRRARAKRRRDKLRI